jgi:hypothetical protein
MTLRSVVSRVTFCLALASPLAAGAQTPVTIPDSPVGKLLKQWYTAFDAADSSALAAFTTAHWPQASVATYMQMRRGSGGIELVRIISADPTSITFGARSRSDGTGLRGVMSIANNDPARILTFGIQSVPAGAPVEGCPTYNSAPTHGTSPADVASEAAIVTALYEAISGPACQHRDWDRFRGLFAPGGRLIPTVNLNGTRGVRVETPDEYVNSVMGSMEEFGFFEKEISNTGESFNGVVHRFSTYESRRKAADDKPFARGINSIQMLNDGKRWWIVTVYWAGERPNALIPDVYLKRP